MAYDIEKKASKRIDDNHDTLIYKFCNFSLFTKQKTKKIQTFL